jgi:hypothetical protein
MVETRETGTAHQGYREREGIQAPITAENGMLKLGVVRFRGKCSKHPGCGAMIEPKRETGERRQVYRPLKGLKKAGEVRNPEEAKTILRELREHGVFYRRQSYAVFVAPVNLCLARTIIEAVMGVAEP